MVTIGTTVTSFIADMFEGFAIGRKQDMKSKHPVLSNLACESGMVETILNILGKMK